MLITQQDVGKRVTFRCGGTGFIFAWNHHHTNPVQIRSIEYGWAAAYTVDGKTILGNPRAADSDITGFVQE